MNDLIVEIYDKLLFICKTVTDNHELTEDLRQEVVTDLLQMDEEKVLMLHDQGRLEKYATSIAFRKWYFNNGTEVGQKDNSCFRYVYRDFNFVAGTDIEDLKSKLFFDEYDNEEDIRELYRIATENLDPLEREILKEYTRRNCKVSQYAKDVGLSRQQLTKRIDFIKEKIKKGYE